MPLEIVRNDITKMPVDAIVNAANTELRMGGGVCGAIFKAAGPQQLQAACEEIGGCPVGEAVATEGFQLPVKYIIHTAGPVWQGGSQGEAELLKSSYWNSMKLAVQLGCESIAFPLISTGIYGYPKEQALQTALSAIHEFLLAQELLVYLVVFDKQSFGFSEKISSSIHQFIDEHYVEAHIEKDPRHRRLLEMDISSERMLEEASVPRVESQSLEEMLKQIDESFSQRLLHFIDEKGMSDVETYRKANIDRKLFSKIRNSAGYTPQKKTAIAFAIALELDLQEAKALLSAAGYTLSRSSVFDLIIEYFITQQNYDIFEINEALFAFDQATLGA